MCQELQRNWLTRRQGARSGNIRMRGNWEANCASIRLCLLYKQAHFHLRVFSNNIHHLCLLKVMTNLDSIFKSRDITLSTKIHVVKAMVLPVVMHGCESWAIKKAERRIIDGFQLWCWRRLLRVPWTARRSSQSILKEISPEYSLEGLMLKLKLQYFGHLK